MVVLEERGDHKTEALQDTFEPWQLSDIVLSVRISHLRVKDDRGRGGIRIPFSDE